MTVHGILALLLFCHDRELYAGWLEVYKRIQERVYGPERRREVQIDETVVTGGTTAAMVEAPTPAAV